MKFCNCRQILNIYSQGLLSRCFERAKRQCCFGTLRKSLSILYLAVKGENEMRLLIAAKRFCFFNLTLTLKCRFRSCVRGQFLNKFN